jgi:outer membrane protein insertion porin family
VIFRGALVLTLAGILLSSYVFAETPKPPKKSPAKPQSAQANRARKGVLRPLPPENPTGLSKAAEALDGRTVSNIDVTGLKRIEKDAVISKITTRGGQPLSAEQVRSDIQALFTMGYFDDIEVRGEAADGNRVNLTYVLRERPVIAEIEFDGNERIDTKDLEEVIKVKQWSILDVNKVKEDTALIQKHYEEKGFYLAKVTFEVRTLKEDQVRLVYKVSDYDKVQIKKITFLNNKRFSDEQLKGVFRETSEGGFFSFISSSGNFKESAFKQDLQILTYWYLDQGYVKFRYENPVVTVSDDKKFLYITIYVDEGEQYTMGTVDFGGDLLFTKDELNSDITLETGQTFSISKRNADIQKLQERYQDLGYAFVNVIPKMNVKDDEKTVDIQYDFEKGNLVYFGEINAVGNSKTHDKVIRRELRIHEGELYSGTKMRISRENVERLGYFAPGEVIFNTKSPKGKPDVLDVEIIIKERSTGTITLGAGYGSVNGFFLTTQVAEINLLGRGQTISLQANYAVRAVDNSVSLGFTDPFAFDTRWSMGFDVFRTVFNIPNKYITKRLGFNLRVGHPVQFIDDYTNFFITYKNEGMQLDRVQDGVDPAFEADRGVLSSMVFSAIRDKRNNRFETTAGNYQAASFEFAGIGGDKRFVKWNLNNRFYQRVVGDLVFRNSVEVGQIKAWGGGVTPPSERFYLGGPNNLKGYPIFLVGPTRLVTAPDANGNQRTFREPLGGNFQMFGIFELEYPLVREAGLKAVTFYDVGNAWSGFPGGDDPFVLRQDVGFGIRWFSPIGPLRFEWGFPLNRRPQDNTSEFVFFIGPPF